MCYPSSVFINIPETCPKKETILVIAIGSTIMTQYLEDHPTQSVLENTLASKSRNFKRISIPIYKWLNSGYDPWFLVING